MKIHSIYAAGAAAALVLGLAACGDTEDDPTPMNTDPAVEQTEESEDDSTDPADDPTETEDSEDVSGDGAGELTEEDGVLVDTDLEANILEGSGVAVTVNQDEQTVLFELLDPQTGDSYENTFEFDFDAGEYRHHKYVSAMGATFDYTMDMETNEIQSIIDSSGEEGIDAVIEQGRLEIAQTDRDSEREELEQYFQDRYGMSVEQAATELG